MLKIQELGLEINPNDNQQRLYIYVRAYPVGRSDYKIAIEEGSTLVRIGSSIFGTRQYN